MAEELATLSNASLTDVVVHAVSMQKQLAASDSSKKRCSPLQFRTNSAFVLTPPAFSPLTHAKPPRVFLDKKQINMPHETLPYWHFNIPIEERTTECPDYLQNLSEKDKRLIGTWDDEFEVITWEEAKDIVRMFSMQRTFQVTKRRV